MLLLASFVAADPEIQELFKYGTQMVRVEGGAKGAGESSRLRQALLEEVEASWKQMQRDYNLRQLHFHLPPATSFLRVHQPGKYGDDLSDIRQIIVDSNRMQEPLSGFEIIPASAASCRSGIPARMAVKNTLALWKRVLLSIPY